MLRKYYEYIGRRYTLAGEVPQQVRYLARRGCAYAGACPVPGIYARGELEAASWKLVRAQASCELEADTLLYARRRAAS